MEISDRVAVVTGGGSGIGEGLVRRFAADGARRVYAVDVAAAAVERVVAELDDGDLADRVVARPLDVSDADAVQALVDEVLAAEGHIDLFVSNAGVFVDGDEHAPDDDWDRVFAVNTMAHVYAARAVLPAMLARGEGYLLQTVSAAGLLTQIGAAPYTVSKAAALSFAEWLAITHGDDGITVSALCPQGVTTGMTFADFTDLVSGDGMLTPEQVADAVVEGLREERFLILPHPEVAEYVRFKADDRDRWLRGMRKLKARYH